MRFIHGGAEFSPFGISVAAPLDWDGLARDAATLPLDRLALAKTTWSLRAQTEFQSIQTLNGLLGEMLEAGDPIEVWNAVATAVTDEIRHTTLCVGVVEALGAQALFPEAVVEPEARRRLPAAARALERAIAMLAINETLSTALLTDLTARATHPTIHAVLAATIADEDTHRDFGWLYIASSLRRFDANGIKFARTIAAETLARFERSIAAVTHALPADKRTIAAYDEPELATFGLLSPAREALLLENAITTTLRPRLRAHDLL